MLIVWQIKSVLILFWLEDPTKRLVSYKLASTTFGYQGKGKKLDGQMLMVLGINEQGETINSIRYFARSKDAEAVEEYNRLEDDPLLDIVVLVSVKNVVDVQKAYPNYYADTSLFLAFVQKQKNRLLTKLMND